MEIESFHAVYNFGIVGTSNRRLPRPRRYKRPAGWEKEMSPLYCSVSVRCRAEIIVTHATDTLCISETHIVTGQEVYCPHGLRICRHEAAKKCSKEPGFGLVCRALEAYDCIRACVVNSSLENEQIQNSGVIRAGTRGIYVPSKKNRVGRAIPCLCISGWHQPGAATS